MQRSISDKIADRLSHKLKKSVPYRTDFVLADFRVLDNDKKEAEVLLQYDADLFGTPSREAVAEALTNLYKAGDERPRIVPDPESVKFYPQFCAVACRVKVPTIRRPLTDVKKYKLKPIVGGTMFLGENMTDTWTVAKNDGGNIFIERMEEDDIDTILRERSANKMFRVQAGVSRLTLNRVAASAPTQSYSLGDFVRCNYRGNIVTAEILGLSDSGAQIRLKDGRQATVAMGDIYNLISAAEKTKQISEQSLKEYYRKAYGYDEEELNKLVSYIE